MAPNDSQWLPMPPSGSQWLPVAPNSSQPPPSPPDGRPDPHPVAAVMVGGHFADPPPLQILGQQQLPVTQRPQPPAHQEQQPRAAQSDGLGGGEGGRWGVKLGGGTRGSQSDTVGPSDPL